MINSLKNKNIYLVLTILIIGIIPFVIHDSSDNIEPKIINDSSIGYYQSTTCKISLSEVIFSNIGNTEKLYFNNNGYAGGECFGKVTGLDKVKDVFFVSIGTNTLFTFILQSVLWLLLLFLFFPSRDTPISIPIAPSLLLPFLLCFHIIYEERFYSNSDKYFDISLKINNYYLVSYFLAFLLVCIFIRELYQYKQVNIFYLLPFMFVFFTTYQGMNLNFYTIFFSYFGLLSIFKNYFPKKLVIFYFAFSVVWIFNKKVTQNYFDTDKLRGFINSSNNLGSSIYWIVVIFLFLCGIYYLTTYTKSHISILKISNNFLISGFIIIFSGIGGSYYALLNFINFLLYGQNKRGMKDFNSIEGNTWRGLLPSAEFGGEVFAVSILLLFYIVIFKKNKLSIFQIIGAIFCAYGLYRSNNFAATVSLVIFGVFIYISSRLNLKKIKVSKYLIFIGILIVLISILSFSTYKTLNSSLVEEAVLHSDLYQNSDNYKSYLIKDKFFTDKDFQSILIYENSYLRASSSLAFLINRYTSGIGIPFVPNIVGVLGFISLLINRTEMWGIFIAKYNPSTLEAFFGFGPLQMSNYLYDHKVRLDVTENKITSLYLPHSSILDLIIFIGYGGVLALVIFIIFKIFKKEYNKNVFLILFTFLIINIIKSDSILYIPSFVMLSLFFTKSFLTKNE